MKKNNIGLYIHVPFCRKKCAYCDFYSLTKAELIDTYADTICQNIKRISSTLSDFEVDTVFFGGGTPSLLGALNFHKIFDALNRYLYISKDVEISVEVNPATVEIQLATAFKELNVNRVSIGLQSTNGNELRELSRIHSYNDFLNTYELIKTAVTDNISVDLMYGTPLQSLESLNKSLADIVMLDPNHISVYGLKIESDTPFGRMVDKLVLPSEDIQSKMYENVVLLLSQNGYNRYEISNFAKEGFECRHNLKYWQREEYIGLGPSAYSFFKGKRFSFKRDIVGYIKNSNGDYEKLFDENRVLTNQDVYNESIMLALRLEKGIMPDERTLSFAEKYVKAGFMKYDGRCLSFTTKGFLVSNFILSDLII